MMHAIWMLVLVLLPCMAAEKRDELISMLPLECLKEYKEVVSKLGDERDHCLRLQIIVNCFSKKDQESVRVLDDMRYLFTQESIFVKTMGICPNIDYDDLKKITDKTAVAQKHKYLDSIDDDEDWDECAGAVHKICIKKYLSLMHNGKLCNDVDAWIDCYEDEAKRAGCDATILTHFKSMLKVVGKSVVKAIRRFMGAQCSKSEL